MSVAGVLVVVGLAAAAAAQHGTGITGDREQRYVDPQGWSFVYPGTMHVESSGAQLRISVSEVTVASFQPLEAVKSGRTSDSAWLRVDPPQNGQGVFPADAVAFRMLSREGGPVPIMDLPETHFPLRLSSFRTSSAYPETKPRPVERTVVANGRTYLAQAWVGPRASPTSRATLGRVVASLSFPSLHVGETVGNGFRVLAPASRYPVGTFARIRLGREAFYLVHAPGGVYGIHRRSQTLVGGFESRCDLRLDRQALQFYCRSLTARWDRIGRALVRARGAARGDPLDMTLAQPAWDGHILLNPGSSHRGTVEDAHRLWPTWRP